MYTIAPKLRLDIVNHYLKSGESLRSTAERFHVSYRTVVKWIKLYRREGEERLLTGRHWNRKEKELEEKIMLLKERNPCLTVRKAKEILHRRGIEISIKGIWSIWRRYGYAGLRREDIGDYYTMSCPWTREAKEKFEEAKDMYHLGNIKASADILNSIPVVPDNEFILQIPDRYLNLRRRVEKTTILLGKIPVRSYLKKTRRIFKECKKRKLYYSAFRIGISEIIALSWSADPIGQLKKIEELKNMLYLRELSKLPFELRFMLLISEGIAYAQLLKIDKALEIAKSCGVMLKRMKNIPSYFTFNLAILNTYLDNIREAEYWYLRSLKKLDDEKRKVVDIYLAEIYLCKGEYQKAIQIYKRAQLSGWGFYSRKLLAQSIWSLVNGMPRKAITLSTKALIQSRKEEVSSRIISAYFVIASSYASFGEKKRAKNILRRLLPFLIKNRLKRVEIIYRILLSQSQISESFLPSAKLALLLKSGNYKKAYKFACKKGLLSYLHRYIFFYPELITENIEKGISTGLPKAMLKLPIFNEKALVYDIRFLGNPVVYKNQKYLKIKLLPKDAAFVIQLALKAGEPGKMIFLKNLYDSFWPDSSAPARNLSHLLVRTKKALRIPSHLLEISHRKGEGVLINRGIHFITDYGKFDQVLVTAHAFMRSGKWSFARREFLRAFRLFRGIPLKGMFDRWSDDLQRVILNRLEREAISFVKGCLEHRNRRDARRVLERVSRIIPHSREIAELERKLK